MVTNSEYWEGKTLALIYRLNAQKAAVQAGWRIAGLMGAVQAFEHVDFPGGHVGTWESLCAEYEIKVTG